MNDGLLTIEELSEYMQLSKEQIIRLIRLKKLPYIKLGQEKRFLKADIELWLRSNSKIRKNSAF